MTAETYDEQLASVSSMTTEAFAAALSKKPLFLLTAFAGDLVILPPGMVFAECSLTNTSFLRWGMWGNRGQPEASVILRVVSAMMESNAALRATKYLSWLEQLQSLF